MTRKPFSTPGGFRPRTPGWVLLRVPVAQGDKDQVRQRWSNEPWAGSVRYLGAARGLHVFERPPTEGA